MSISKIAKTPFNTAADRLGQDLLTLHKIPAVQVDLRYNGTRNFMGVDLYQGFSEAYLHQDAWHMLVQAAHLLQRQKPGWCFLVFDALRPRSVQRKMRQFVTGTPEQEFVADPSLGSMHNFGMAVDLTLQDAGGCPLDMGTEFDDFSDKAQPQLEDQLLQKGELTPAQVSNRRMLRQLMESAGFQQLPHEWWHYNAKPGAVVRRDYKIVE
jgi:D-alanyl-D-alanine dipeptidase